MDNTKQYPFLQKFSISISYSELSYNLIQSYKVSNDDSPLSDKITVIKGSNKLEIILLIKNNLKIFQLAYNNDDFTIGEPETFRLSKKIEDIIQDVQIIKCFKRTIYLSTNNLIYCQEIDEQKSKLIFNLENYGTINDFFIFEVDGKLLTKVIINNNIIVEIKPEIDESSSNTIATVLEILKTGKIDPKKFSSTKFEVNSFNLIFSPYQVVKSIDGIKCFNNIICFENPKVKVTNIKFRPNKTKTLGNNNYVVCFEFGFLGLFHHETNALVALYKTSYGGIISIEFSHDGNVLALGCEDDNIYVLDCDKNLLLFCLIGHQNYVSSIQFLENYENQEINEQTPSNVPRKSLKSNKKNLEENIDIYSLISEINELELNDNKSYLHANDLKNSKIRLQSSNNVLNFNSTNEDTIINNYILLSSGQDGAIASWQVQYLSSIKNKETTNSLIPDHNKVNKLDNFIKVISLDIGKENTIRPISILRVSPNQIFKMTLFDNILLYYAKINHSKTEIYFKLFHSKIIKSKQLIKKDKKQNLNSSMTEISHSTKITKTSK